MKKTTFWKSLFLLCALIVGSSSAWATDKTMTFVQSSSSAGTLSGDVPDGVTATFNNTYTTKDQLTANNSMTLTISGWASTTTIKGVTLEVRNNKSAGSGTATVTIGETTLGTLDISGLGNTYQEKEVEITATNATSDLVIYIDCSEKSVYCDKFIITYEEAAPSGPSISVDPSSVNATAEGGSSSIDVTYNNIDTPNAEVLFYESNGTTAATYDWVNASINNDNDVAYTIIANTGAARTAYMKVHQKNTEVYSPLITITQAKPAVNYTLATSVVPGRHYIVASGTSGSVKVMGNQSGNNCPAKDLTVSDESISVKETDNVLEVLIGLDEESGFFTLYDEINDKYLCGSGDNSNNHLKLTSTIGNTSLWTILVDNNNVATIKANFSGRNWMRYNSGNNIFSCYGSGQQNIYLYEKNGDTGSQEFTASINAACTDGKGNYYGTFSAPFAFTVPAGVTVSEIGISEGKLDVGEYPANAIIPANTGVMISSETAGNKTFTSAKGGTSLKGNSNRLRPTYWGLTAKEMGEADDDCLFYRLTMHNGTQIGYYWGAENGAEFAIVANKAYLAVPASAAGARTGFTFDNTATGINGVEEIAPVTKSRKVVKNGRLVIETANGEFTIDGARVK